MIVHVLTHDPAVRRCRLFSTGHAPGIIGHARPEYSRSVTPQKTGNTNSQCGAAVDPLNVQKPKRGSRFYGEMGLGAKP